MKFNVYFSLKSPAGKTEVPNSINPVECANMASLLTQLSGNLPGGVEVVGLRISAVNEETLQQAAERGFSGK